MILAVVIVFNDPSTGANRPIEEKHAACGTHRHAHGILVRWRDIDGTRIVTTTDDLGFVHAVVIHPNRNQLSPGRQESLARPGIARFFHPHPIFRIQQNLCGKLQRLL